MTPTKEQDGAAALLILLITIILAIPLILGGIKVVKDVTARSFFPAGTPIDCATQKCQRLSDGRVIYQNGDVRLKNGVLVVCGFCPSGPTDIIIPTSVLEDEINKAQLMVSPSPTDQ